MSRDIMLWTGMKAPLIQRALLCLVTVLATAGAGFAAPEHDFWKWFQANQDALYEFESNQAATFDRLHAELRKVHPDLTFEFGPKSQDGSREFIISADGLRVAFPYVERLFSSAPSLKRWKFIKFRPRRTPMAITIAGQTISPEDVHFALFRDGDKIGIMLFFEDYKEAEEWRYLKFGFLFLDGALGEYVVENRGGVHRVQ